MDFRQIKDAFFKIAPVAASLVGSPMAGMAIKVIGEAIGIAEPTAERVASAIESGSLSPEQVVAIRTADAALKVRLKELGIDEKKIDAEVEKAYLADTQDARRVHAGDRGVFLLGIAILLIMLIDVIATFALVYAILTGGISVKDVGLVAAVFGLLGTLNGYVAANAQQVISYYFGTTRGSMEKSREMSEAVRNLGGAVKTAS